MCSSVPYSLVASGVRVSVRRVSLDRRPSRPHRPIGSRPFDSKCGTRRSLMGKGFASTTGTRFCKWTMPMSKGSRGWGVHMPSQFVGKGSLGRNCCKGHATGQRKATTMHLASGPEGFCNLESQHVWRLGARGRHDQTIELTNWLCAELQPAQCAPEI